MNLEILVQEIVLPPHAAPWFAQIVKSVVHQSPVRARVTRSAIEEFGDLLQRCREIAAEVRRDPSELKLDFIEDVPELEGATVVKVRDFEEDVERADSVREDQILPALEADGLVVLDFSGIRVATQSFIHALLYRVFRDGNHVETSLSIAGADRATQEAIRAVTAYARVS